MPDKTIRCYKCDTYVGTLKEGSRVMKGLIYICPTCQVSFKGQSQSTNIYEEIMGYINKKRY